MRGGPHCNRHQVDDWSILKGRTNRGEVTQGQEEGRKRTGVDCEHDHRSHQDNPSLVRTQDPGPPDDDAIGDKILNQKSRETDQFTGGAWGQYVYEAGTALCCTHVDEKNVVENR